MNIEITDLNKIKLFNIVDMGLTFSAMIRLYEKDSKQNIRDQIIQILKEISNADSEDQFELYHEKFCDWGVQNIVLAEKVKNKRIIKESGPASYGQIAKTLDVVLKVAVHYCFWPDPKKSKELSEWLHAAIDNKMMQMLEEEYSDQLLYWPLSVEAVDKGIYKKLQQVVKKFIQEKHGGMILPVNFDDIYWNVLNRQTELIPEKPDIRNYRVKRIATPSKKRRLHTRGGSKKRIEFEWWFDENINLLMIETEKRHKHQFYFDEVLKILRKIKSEFGSEYFPLANNVEKLGNGNEIRGLGTLILDLNPGEVTHAQGSSYLGPVLEEIGYFEWNEKQVGIKWRLIRSDIDAADLKNRLKGRV